VQLITQEKVPIVIKVLGTQLEKYFEVGECVRVLQGMHSG